ncbi:hypothetical protein Rsub_03186 [Raphidocelis subcapitata]|uniref:ZN622/Rei1/Reh1 zinc finger C2H2-type domain-containing protein n=1 Tax=Raphidocelis subcapitata TaxID=307507 RepID=A0A2V0NSK7_9CHLO|nr:hypothetical protein Rsub_03186 [Raphidocelis subcapitata]|eukprot:GBF90614.1 hypothetical protein Rsub_03186 [Raphidocelis subcapitata]
MATESGPSAGPVAAEGRATGFFCSTSGTYFTDKESLAEHYRSDFHRYNLKRKVAGLPPVTKDWFDARKAQLASAAAAPTQRVWYDPLTRRKFMSEPKYREHVASKKYADLVKRSGAPAPAPVVMLKRLDGADGAPAGANGAAAAEAPAPARPAPGFVAKAPHRPAAAVGDVPRTRAQEEDEEDEEGSASEADGGWETASADDDDEAAASAAADALASAAAGLSLGVGRRRAAAARAARADAGSSSGSGSDAGGDDDGEWEDWDVRRSLFDNRTAPSMEDNLDYMYRKFGFYLPDAEYLVDPAGLLRYLGSKLQYGRVPLYTCGDDPNARQFRSLHAVQRHMVDANRCRMAYDDNEDEYAEFYDYSSQYRDGEDGQDEAAAGAGGGGAAAAAAAVVRAGAGFSERLTASGLEMVVGGGGGGGDGGGGGGKVLGSRWLVRYYRQRPRPAAAGPRAASGAPALTAAASGVVAQYRALGVETRASAAAALKRAQRAVHRSERQRLNLAMKANKLHNLPNNVPY